MRIATSVKDTESLRYQPFHCENSEFFRDYEELDDRKQKLLYDKESIIAYMAFCRRKPRT